MATLEEAGRMEEAGAVEEVVSIEKISIETTRFSLDDFYGEIVPGFEPSGGELAPLVRRLVDPGTAEETVHWGRNYLYRTRFESSKGAVEVVVKQFNNRGLKATVLRRLRGSKAELGWRVGLVFQEAGLATAEPVLLIESRRSDGPSFLVTRRLEETIELRYVLRAANQDEEKTAFPWLNLPTLLNDVGHTLRQMHAAGVFHRDLSIGNVLISKSDPHRLYIIDLNRARILKRIGMIRRTRDLCRLALFRPADQRTFLRAYWGRSPGFWKTGLYKLLHHGFLFKIGSKKRWRRITRRLRQALIPRRAHAHIPAAPAEAAARDKVAWDHLSDQPYQHANRFEKTLIRLADLPSHAQQTAFFVASLPGIWSRYRGLMNTLYQNPVPWNGAGICVRPHPEAPEELLRELDELGLKKVLLRLHPWDDRHDAELELARDLNQRGYEIAFSLPQNRDLVRNQELWRDRISELAELFTPYGRHFQIGQAINRSKWGIWTPREYAELARGAAQILRRYDGVEILGPAVIDFEYHATIAALRLCSDLRFDAVASLLYVDRRGAPENRQLGFDTIDKVILLQALAEKIPGVRPRSWITEVNWPLWEGPHSPAGRSVSVTEELQADYLTRFYLLALTTGAAERVYWWQLIARGYGLIAPREASRPLKRRASYHALATLERELCGAVSQGPLPGPRDTFLFLFRLSGGEECVAGWCRSSQKGRIVTLPRRVDRMVDQQGNEYQVAGRGVELSSSVRYFHLERP